MVTPDLLSYIKAALASEQSADDIRAALKANGWEETDINEAFTQAGVSQSAPSKQFDVQVQPMRFERSERGPQGGQEAARLQQIDDTVSKKRWPAVLLGVAVALLVSGGSAFAYLTFFKQSPEEIFVEAVFNEIASQSRSVEIVTTVETSIRSDDPEMQELLAAEGMKTVVDLSTRYNILDVEDPRADGTLDISVTPNQDLGFGEGEAFGGAVSFRVVDDSFYVAITRLPAILALFGLGVEGLLNKWVHIDLEGAAKAVEEFDQRGVATEDIFTILDDEAIYKKFQESFSKEFLRQIEGKRVVSVAEELPSEDIAGDAVYRYRLDFHTEEFKDALIRAFNKANTEMELGITESDTRILVDDLDTALGALGLDNPNTRMEVSIGKKDHIFRAGTYTTKTETETFLGDTLVADIDVRVNLPIVDRNKDITIAPPANSISVEEFLEEFMGSAFESNPDLEVKSVLSTMRAQAELYYDMNGQNYGMPKTLQKNGIVETPCMQKTFNAFPNFVNETFADEDAALYLEVFQEGSLTCALGASGGTKGAQSYALSASLPSTPEVSYCVDSTGYADVGEVELAQGVAKCKEVYDYIEEDFPVNFEGSIIFE